MAVLTASTRERGSSASRSSTNALNDSVSDPIKMQVVHAIGRPPNEQWAFFALNSPDNDQGCPGPLRIEARVVLRTKPGMMAEVELDFAAMHDHGWQGPPTPLNLTWYVIRSSSI